MSIDNLKNIIEDRKKLSEEAKSNIISSIFFDCIIAIIMVVIVFIVNISFSKVNIVSFEKYIKIIQIVVCIISIVLFETAYKKDSMKIGLYGIEFLMFSITILFIPYMYIFNNNINFLNLVIIFFIVYYIIKAISTILIIRHNYLKNNMSDVKEIVKDDKKGYIDEESKKTLKERKIKNIQEKKNTKKNVPNKTKNQNKSKKRK